MLMRKLHNCHCYFTATVRQRSLEPSNAQSVAAILLPSMHPARNETCALKRCVLECPFIAVFSQEPGVGICKLPVIGVVDQWCIGIHTLDHCTVMAKDNLDLHTEIWMSGTNLFVINI